MAKTKEEQTTALAPSLVAGPLATRCDDDPIAAAFADGLDGVKREEPAGIEIVTIDHNIGMFLLNGEPVERIEGYPIHYVQTRAWWESPFKPGQTSPPDCRSSDCVTPDAASPKRQSQTCYTCRHAQWGSAAVGDGQACGVSTGLFLVGPAFGTQRKACLLLPPSSIKPLLGTARKPGYLQRAKNFRDPRTGRMAKYFELVWTSFALKRPEGAKHVVIEPTPLAVAPNAEEAKIIATARKELDAQVNAVRGAIRAVETQEASAG